MPTYLSNLIPKKIGKERPNSRFPDNYLLSKVRTETFRQSFVPSTLSIWNNLPTDKQNLESVQDSCKFEPKKLFYFGNRLLNIKHAQLRMHCSKLNTHLFKLHVVPSPACSCGCDNEDSNHYLLHCPVFHVPRVKLLSIHQVCFTSQYDN